MFCRVRRPLLTVRRPFLTTFDRASPVFDDMYSVAMTYVI
jgi:hypothetical protein